MGALGGPGGGAGAERQAPEPEGLEAARRKQLLERLRIGAGLAAVLVPGGILLDQLRYEGATVERMALLRGGFAVLCAGVVAASFSRGAARFAVGLSFAFTISAGLTVIVLGISSGHPSPVSLSGLTVILLASALLFPWRAGEMAAAAAVLGGLLLGALRLLVPGSPSAALAGYFFLSTAAAAIFAAHARHAARRQELLALRALEERTRELSATSSRLERSLESQRRLATEKAELFANVNHELRNALTLVLSPAESLGELTGEVSDRARAAVTELRRNAQALHGRLSGLLDLAQLEAGGHTLIRDRLFLQPLLAGVLEELVPVAQRRGLRLTLEAGANPAVDAERQKLETVVRNLIANAVKFTPSGGSVTVRLERRDELAVVEVSDTGVGIAASDHPRVFERFARLGRDGAARGAGVGLSLARQLVELHGGTLTFRSEEGQGSQFEVSLPAVGEGPAAPVVPPVPPSAEEQSSGPAAGAAPDFRPMVLVAEDEEGVRAQLVRCLGSRYRVLEAGDGAAALELARGERPALIVSDVVMPGMDGLELARRLWAAPALRHTPLIFLSARANLESRLEGLGLAVDYVEKPFSPAELLARIDVHLRLAGMTERLVQAKKLSLLSTLSSGLAHEIRNPLNVVQNGALVLSRDLAQVPPRLDRATEVVEAVREGSASIATLIQSLLTGLGEGAPLASWRPREELALTLRMLSARTTQVSVHLELDFDGEVAGRPAQLNQVVLNLIDNALRATSPGGNVWLEGRAGAGHFQLTVSDDGHGVPAELSGRLFDPFVSTRSDGTGLGLYVSRRIVEAHGGELSWGARPEGRGASFRVTLPLRAELPS